MVPRINDSEILHTVEEREYDLLVRRFLTVKHGTSSAFHTKGLEFK
jgi:hypothetical protein